MPRYDTEILDLASDLAIGDRSSHLVCPSCLGGDGGERSLLIWCEAGKLTYKCYRAKCSFRGVVGQTGYRPLSTKKKTPRYQVKMLNPQPLPEDVTDWLLFRFPWLDERTLHINGVQWCPDKEKVLYPIRSIEGVNEGYLARRYDELVICSVNKRSAKALAYHYPMPDTYTLTGMMAPNGSKFEDYVVVYEDFPSALRSNEYLPSIALSGTSLGEATLLSLVKAGKRKVCLVLDADATQKAAAIVHKYSLYFHSFTFVPLLDKDPKDLDSAAMEDLITTIRAQLKV